MKKLYFITLLLFISFCALAQSDSASKTPEIKLAPYEKKTIILTCAVGFIDQFKNELKLPPDYQNNNVSGYVPVYIRGEYGLTNNVSIGASFAYDVFNDNFDQYYYGNNETNKRYYTDNIRILSFAAMGYYHFGSKLHVKNLDPFAGIGVSLNNIRHGNAPQPDSVSAAVVNHTATLYAKAGVRYYLDNRTSLYGEIGFDQHSILALGFSYRFRHVVKPADTAPPKP